MSWAPLHVHSQYSILNSAASIEALTEKAKAHQLPAIALTDQGNMFGAVEFFKACKTLDLKPIIGCELHVAPKSRFEKKRIPGLATGFPIVLLAKNKQGYQNLCRLSSLAYLEGFYYTPRIDKELLAQCSDGLICLSGPLNAILAHLLAQEKEQELRAEIDWYRTIFQENYYFELLRHEMSDANMRSDLIDQESWLLQLYRDSIKNQNHLNCTLQALSQELSIGCVAANDIRYIDREDWHAHEILMNIQSGEPCEIWERDSFGNPKARVKNPKRQVSYTHELYFKSPEEMRALFADIPEALDNTLKIAESCQFEFDFKARFYPVFVPPHLENTSFTKQYRLTEAEKFLKNLCEQGIPNRYTQKHLEKVKEQYPDQDPLDVVHKRLEYELSIIVPKGMSDYLLIVWDFIAWAKANHIPMGPGRGSGVGSIVLYLIGVTDIEPLRFNLFFERFINPDRISYPDIDVDICMDRRAEVMDYTVRKYGKDKVAQIITFGTMKAKMAIKDVGRVLNIPLVKVNAIAKLVPDDLNMTIDKALEIDPELEKIYQEDAEVHRLLNIAKKLEGSVRNTGIHAAGIIICGDPLLEHIPICSAKDSGLAVTQYSMKPVENVGMLKIDFLGLKTLTTIQHALDAIKIKEEKAIDWINLPLEDAPTFNLLNQGKTLGVFQLESGGIQDLAKQLHIDTFEEIIAVVSLYRPGPMEMIPSFINRKHGRESSEIDHPLMERVLKETYGIMVYQEQVMQIASLLAGYTLGEGDVLRRAMGKKDKEEMSKQRAKFREGALKNNISEEKAMFIFDKVEKFASYGFNKSHAAAYAYLSYVTAYLKANYRSEWMAALMTSDRDDLSKITRIIRECHAFGIAILAPDINESSQTFVATSKGIRFAMNGIKGVGEGVVQCILEERQKKGPFKSLYDFIKRMTACKIGKKIVDTLIEAGCFDFTGWTRQALCASVAPMITAVSKEHSEYAKGIVELFSLIKKEGEEDDRFKYPPETKEEISRQLLLKREYELLGLYLHGHPLDEYRNLIENLQCIPLCEMEMLADGSLCRIACIIESVTIKISSKSQRKFAILGIGDGTESRELPIWSDLYEQHSLLLRENQMLCVILHKDTYDDNMRLQCRWLSSLTEKPQEIIHACNAAYETTKSIVPRDKKRLEKPMEKEKNPTSRQRLRLVLDADMLLLSHILAVKEVFRSYAGNIPIAIEFISQEKYIGTVQIDATWGVEDHPLFEKQMQRLRALKKFIWE